MVKKLLSREILAPLLFLVAFFIAWEALVRGLNISPFILPTFSDVMKACVEFKEALLVHSFVTLWRTLVGFAISVVFGLVIGAMIGGSRFLYAAFYPIMVGFNCVPKVAVVPILVIWFGNGAVPAILTAFLISFFPIVVNVATGIATLEPEMEDVLRALGANRLTIFLKVGLPRSMPYFLGSLKVAVTLAFVGTVISETIASNEGVGNMLLLASANFELPLLFAWLLALAVEGIAMYALFAWLEQRLASWAFRSGHDG